MRIRRKSHCVFNINYHFVWRPKYRHSYLDTVEDTLTDAVHESLRGTETDVSSLHISPDHIHLFVSTVPTTSPVEVVRRVKSITARRLWSKHGETMQRLYWGGGCWERSYYVGTAGTVSAETVKEYIERTDHL